MVIRSFTASSARSGGQCRPATRGSDHSTESHESPVHETVATIDNGKFGTRTIRFETGRLARQAAGSVVAYLDDDTMLLSATTASKSPKEQLRLLPADRGRRGADVRRRSHPRLVLPPRGTPERGRDPHLPADRPAAAPVVRQGPAQRGAGRHHGHGAHPDHLYDVRGHQRGVGVDPAVRPAVQRPDRRRPGWPSIEGQWVAFPTYSAARAGDLRHGRRRPGRCRVGRRRDHDGRGRGHRERHRADRRRRHRGRPRRSCAEGLEAAKPFIAELCRAQAELAKVAAKPTVEFPVFLGLRATTSSPPSSAEVAEPLAQALTIADKQEREAELDRIKELTRERSSAPQFEGREQARSAPHSGR